MPFALQYTLATLAGALASAGLIGVGLFWRRRGGGRRAIFLVAGVACAALSGAFVFTMEQFGQKGSAAATRLVLGCAALALLGVPLVAVGWRGRRVGDHPHCRRCGFDLFGKPAESTRCGECGAELHLPRATVIGVRRRRPALVVAGLALALAALIGAGRPAYDLARDPDWLARWKPTRRLLADARAQNWRVAGAAAVELERRLSRDALSPKIERWLLDDAFPARPPPGWRGPTVLDRRSVGRAVFQRKIEADEAAVRRVLRGMLDFDLQPLVGARPIVAPRGEPVPLLLGQSVPFNPPSWSTPLQLESAAVTLGTLPVPGACVVPSGSLNVPVWALDLGPRWADVPDGTVALTATLGLVARVERDGRTLEERVTTTVTGTLVVAAPATQPAW